MIDVKFSYNWNKKLDCHAFTTIRLYNSAKHYKGQSVRILLKDEVLGEGMIHEMVVFYLNALNPFMSFIDTGYSLEEARSIILKMYPKVDFTQTRLVMMLIVKNKKEPVKEKELLQAEFINIKEGKL